MILVDALYLVSSGGVSLFRYFTEELIKRNNQVHFLIDNRYKVEFVNKYTSLKPSEKNRKVFYKKHQNEIKAVLCLSNIPPPIKLNVPVHIYFHNDLLIDTSGSNLSLFQKAVLRMKRIYIQYNNQKNYHWHVQTLLIRKKLINKLYVNNKVISVTPFFPSITNFKKTKNRKSNSYIYVAAFSPHKNHLNLLKGFIEAAKMTSQKIILCLTLDSKTVELHLIKGIKLPSNLEIKPLGLISKSRLIKYFKESNFLIYPSLKESFGLPLIEAAQLGLKVIASDLPYTYEVIQPSLVFNPLSIDSIKEIILVAQNLKTIEPTTIKTKNKIQDLIKILT